MTVGAASEYEISVATPADVPDIVELQAQNHISRGGGLSMEFPAARFLRSIAQMPIVIARRGGRLVGYLVSSTKESTRGQALPDAKNHAWPGGPDSYNSGPLCVAGSERGRGLAAKLFFAQRANLKGREGVAFIRCDNRASRAAHARYGFVEVAAFSHGGVDYVVVSHKDRP